MTKGGLVLARNNDAAKEWGSFGARALVPSAITYEPKINSRTVQGERTGAGTQVRARIEVNNSNVEHRGGSLLPEAVGAYV